MIWNLYLNVTPSNVIVVNEYAILGQVIGKYIITVHKNIKTTIIYKHKTKNV